MKTLSFMPAKRLVLSYIWDWIVIIAIAGIGGAFYFNSPYHRPFSLVDLSIQYPDTPDDEEKVPTWLLMVVGLAAPAAVIFLVCMLLVPGPTIWKGTSKSLLWRRKLWEWNTGWMGLALSLALGFLFTQGMKNLFGKPRPNCLARCQPDLSADSIRRNTVGDFASEFNPNWVLVSYAICTSTDTDRLDDAFRSFPSGHASFSWSGLLYLAFFLCSKFAIHIPFLKPGRANPERVSKLDSYTGSQHSSVLPLHHSHGDLGSASTQKESGDFLDTMTGSAIKSIPARNQAAAPPVYLLALPLVPIGAAIYITSTRFFQFYHHGFDILFGSLIGILSAWFAFRWYHLPISQGAGWSWGARSRDRAFAIGVGVPTYVGTEGWSSRKKSGAAATNGMTVADDEVLGHGYEDRNENARGIAV